MQRKCSCTHASPPMRVLRSPEFNSELAQYYCDRGSSGDAIVDAVLAEIYDYHTATLVGSDGTAIPVDSGANTAELDDLFGEDQRRFVNRYREKATRLPKYRLDHRCVFAVTILHLARQIRLCRTRGRCSR